MRPLIALALMVAAPAFLTAPPAMAQVEASRIASCAAIVEASERLRCYDEIATSLDEETRRVVAERAAEEKRLADAKAAETARLAAAAEAERAERARLDLGAEQVIAGGGREARDLESATYTVDDVRSPRGGRAQIVLTNGQVWEQKSGRALNLKQGQEVTIERAAISGYKMTADNIRSLVRVQRIR